MAFILEHTVIGFCIFDLLALILLIGLTIVFNKKVKALKKEQEELTEQLEERMKLPTVEEFAE